MRTTITSDTDASNAFWQAINNAGDGGKLTLTNLGAIVQSNTGQTLDFEVVENGTQVKYY